MPVILPFDSDDANYDFSTTLDGTLYAFDVHWNGRANAWYIAVSDQFGNLIATGIKIVIGVVLGDTCTDPRFPAGALLAFDTANTLQDAGSNDLGTRVIVLYFSAAEIAAQG